MCVRSADVPHKCCRLLPSGHPPSHLDMLVCEAAETHRARPSAVELVDVQYRLTETEETVI
jgi:hypothetical protein